MIKSSGIYKIPSEEYHLDPIETPSLSRGVIMDLLFKSPSSALHNHPRLNPDCKPEVDKKFDLGQVAHGLFLEGIDLACVIDAEDWRKKETKELRDQARAEGKVPLLKHQFGEVNQMVTVANDYLRASELSGLFDDGNAEMTYVWEEGGIWCRVLVDKISKDQQFILDYKTTGGSANPEDFIRMILSHGYDIQDALYRRGVKSVTGIDPKFVFLVQETYAPYLCSLIALSPEFEAMAEQKVIRGMDLWRTCMATGEWPGYGGRIAWVEPPVWSLNWEMRSTFIGQRLEEI